MAVLSSYAPALRFIGRVDPPIAHGLTLNDNSRAPEMVCAGEGTQASEWFERSRLGYGFPWKAENVPLSPLAMLSTAGQ